MIEVVFTVDYEIYGNGEGSLQRLIFEPAERLQQIFSNRNVRFVVFPDVAELEIIEIYRADPDIELIKKQLKGFFREGFEIGLHIHPWWYNARRKAGRWNVDFSEYNLCIQPMRRINEIVDRAIAYLRGIIGSPDFSPISYRAGHLLFQPTQPLADVLVERGIRLDSSVYKGALWRQHKLDYRRAPKNVFYWRFKEDVTTPDSRGALVEVPIYTRQVPIWRMFTSKRIGLQGSGLSAKQRGGKVARRFSDYLRFRYPLKFDLGQMTKEEITLMTNRIFREDRRNPALYRPVVVIIHTKDPINFEAVDFLLDSLSKKHVKVSGFSEVLDKMD